MFVVLVDVCSCQHVKLLIAIFIMKYLHLEQIALRCDCNNLIGPTKKQLAG